MRRKNGITPQRLSQQKERGRKTLFKNILNYLRICGQDVIFAAGKRMKTQVADLHKNETSELSETCHNTDCLDVKPKLELKTVGEICVCLN
ncbi:MAG: hypothetical protein ACI378_00730 [Bacteroides sp.]